MHIISTEVSVLLYIILLWLVLDLYISLTTLFIYCILYPEFCIPKYPIAESLFTFCLHFYLIYLLTYSKFNIFRTPSDIHFKILSLSIQFARTSLITIRSLLDIISYIKLNCPILSNCLIICILFFFLLFYLLPLFLIIF
jgi:hypothetical protein